jgi:hypothetical protein
MDSRSLPGINNLRSALGVPILALINTTFLKINKGRSHTCPSQPDGRRGKKPATSFVLKEESACYVISFRKKTAGFSKGESQGTGGGELPGLAQVRAGLVEELG